MTVEQLNATPLFSTVIYTDKTKGAVEAVIIKTRNNEARLFDKTSGWTSFYIPAADLTLKEVFAPPTYPAPTNFLTMPLYSVVSYKGANAFLLEKEIIQNEFVPDGSQDIQNATIWFIDEEILLNVIPAVEITFVSAPTPSVIPPVIKTGKSNLLLYGAIAIGLYFLLTKKEKGPTA